MEISTKSGETLSWDLFNDIEIKSPKILKINQIWLSWEQFYWVMRNLNDMWISNKFHQNIADFSMKKIYDGGE